MPGGVIDKTKRPFRKGDKVTVHGYMMTETQGPHLGRVVCDNRKSKYNQTLIVCGEDGDSEFVEFFCPDGTRYLPGSHVHLTLGWPKEEAKS